MSNVKKISVILLSVIILFCSSILAYAKPSYSKIEDRANLFTSEDVWLIQENINSIDSVECVSILTVPKSGLKEGSVEKYYNDNFRDKDTVIIVIDMSCRETSVHCYNDASSVLSDKDINDILNSSNNHFSLGNFTSGILNILSSIDLYSSDTDVNVDSFIPDYYDDEVLDYDKFFNNDIFFNNEVLEDDEFFNDDGYTNTIDSVDSSISTDSIKFNPLYSIICGILAAIITATTCCFIHNKGTIPISAHHYATNPINITNRDKRHVDTDTEVIRGYYKSNTSRSSSRNR